MDLGQLLTPVSAFGVDTNIQATLCTKTSTPSSGQLLAASACLGCRDRHLKCDGVDPCLRCKNENRECTYVPSRRGLKFWDNNTLKALYEQHMKRSNAETNNTTPSDGGNKIRLAKDEVARLELQFSINPKPDHRIKSSLAEEMGVEIPRINNWFQNRRVKERQLQKEREYRMTTAKETELDEDKPDHTPSPESESSTPDRLFTAGSVAFDVKPSDGGAVKKKEAVYCLMKHFYSLMGQWYLSKPVQSWTQCHGGPSPKRHKQDFPSAGKGAQAANSDSPRPSGWAAESMTNPERRRFNRDDEDSQEERNHKKPKPKERYTAQTAQRLACPFFRKDPARYQHWRSCPGPGWGTVHRMREHLYRSHVLPPSCPRCHETFEDEKAKLEHFVAPESCSVRDRPSMLEGLDPATHELLKSRKLLHGKDTEEAKWRAVYLVLFPGTEERDLPSPYYEYPGTTTRHDQPYNTETPELAKYEEFLKGELPPHVKKKLSTRVGAALSPRGKLSTAQIESLKQELVSVVQDAQLELFRLYCQTRERSTITNRRTTCRDPEHTPGSTTSAVAEDAVPVGGSPWQPNVLLQSDDRTVVPETSDGWASIPLDGYHNFAGFDGILFDLGALGTGVEATPSSGVGLGW